MAPKSSSRRRPPTGRRRGRPPGSTNAARMAREAAERAAREAAEAEAAAAAAGDVGPDGGGSGASSRSGSSAEPGSFLALATSAAGAGFPPAASPDSAAAAAAGLMAADSESSPRRRRYRPGGAGGGGRFIDDEAAAAAALLSAGLGAGGGPDPRSRTAAGRPEPSLRNNADLHRRQPGHQQENNNNANSSNNNNNTNISSSSVVDMPGRGMANPIAGLGGLGVLDGKSNGADPSPGVPRRERSTRIRNPSARADQDKMPVSSAAAVAAAVVQSEGYKPREERSWEEFHPNLDIDATFMVFSAEEVDGTAPLPNPNRAATPAAAPAAFGAAALTSTFASTSTTTAATAAAVLIPNHDGGRGHSHDGDAESGTPPDDAPAPSTGTTPSRTLGPAAALLAPAPSAPSLTSPPREPQPRPSSSSATPVRRRPARPTRDYVSLYATRPAAAVAADGRPPPSFALTPKKTPKVLPIHNQTPKERLDLKLPSYRKTDRVLLFERKTAGQARCVDEAMRRVGYQETDEFIRPEHSLIKATEANGEDDADVTIASLQAMLDAEYNEMAGTGASIGDMFGGSGASIGDMFGGSGASIGDMFGGSSDMFGGSNDMFGGSSASIGGASGAIPAAAAALGRVEYDMDEQDDMWLDAVNVTRRGHDLDPISRELFEITITKIEKEWHALERRIPKPVSRAPQTHRPRSSSAAAVSGEPAVGEEQDSRCAICDDGDCENTNAIVFCDGCDLAVHQECYGVPFIPEGQWHCRKCQLIGRGIPTCVFCPNTDGAFKQTSDNRWAHLLCAMWIPELSLGNHTFMEPIMEVDKVPRTRWRLACYLCNQKMGACIQCGNKACYQAFHVTCARRARLFLKMKNSHGALAAVDGGMVLKAFCDRHCPPDHPLPEDVVRRATRAAQKFFRKAFRDRIWADSPAAARAMAAAHPHAISEHAANESQMTGAKLSAVMGREEAGSGSGGAGSGAGGGGTDDHKAQLAVPGALGAPAAPAKPIWRLPSGAPVIPQAVFDVVEASLQQFGVRKRKDFVADACRYWTLKREARRGAALIKRLQLQMETFSSMELTRRDFSAMGPVGKARLARRVQFAKNLVGDLAQLRDISIGLVHREREKVKAAKLEESFVDTCYFPISKLLRPVMEKAKAMDKDVFTVGFTRLQALLNDRFYTTVPSFAHDLCDVIHTGINTFDDDDDNDYRHGHPITNPDPKPLSASSNRSGIADAPPTRLSSLLPAPVAPPGKPNYNEIEERQKLGRHIIKGIQTSLEQALRVECEITNKPIDDLLKELDAMVDASFEIRRLPGPAQSEPAQPINEDLAAADDEYDHDHDIAMTDAPPPTEPEDDDVQMTACDQNDRSCDVTGPDGEPMDLAEDNSGEGALTPNMPNDPNMPGRSANGPAAFAAAVPGGPFLAASPAAAAAEAVFVVIGASSSDGQTTIRPSIETSDTPPNSTNGDQHLLRGALPTGPRAQPAPPAAPAAPPTPPRSNGSLGKVPANGDPLSEGGVPWYLKKFEPCGTTAVEAQGDWTDREPARSMSEELTDMDDDELKGLARDIARDNAATAAAAAATDAAAAAAASRSPAPADRPPQEQSLTKEEEEEEDEKDEEEQGAIVAPTKSGKNGRSNGNNTKTAASKRRTRTSTRRR